MITFEDVKEPLCFWGNWLRELVNDDEIPGPYWDMISKRMRLPNMTHQRAATTMLRVAVVRMYPRSQEVF